MDFPVNQQWRLRKLWFACGIGLLILVAVLSLMPVPDVPAGNDKIVHIIMYAFLSGWFSLIVNRHKSLWWVLFGLIAYGLIMEILQGFTEYRSTELADAVANSIGATIGLIFHFTRLRQWLINFDHQLSGYRQ